MYKKIGFIGLGLIGGSIAKTIKAKFPDIELKARATKRATIIYAYDDGVISNNDILPYSDFADCDVIFLCAPVKANIENLLAVKPYISDKCIITDVGSVKGDIEKAVAEAGMSSCFIGGHPMAGTEEIGYEHASEHLLENAYYILTNNGIVDAKKFGDFYSFIRNLGAIPLEITAEEHDFATAAISHLPHVISAALVNTVRNNETESQLLKTIAAGGFRDITRISSSSPVMWEHICLTNKDQILNMFDLYIREISKFKDLIAASDGEGINELFSDAKEYRDSLPIKGSSILPQSYDFYMDLDDKAGGIATVSTILAAKDISIKNIGIIHNREYRNGVLHIEFYKDADRNLAIETLEYFNYVIYRE